MACSQGASGRSEGPGSSPPVRLPHSVRGNALALLGLQVANALIPLVTLPHVLRVLGPDQFGALSLSQAVLQQGVILADFGFNLCATQRVAQAQQRGEDVSRIFWSVQAAKGLLALLACALLAALTWSLPTLRGIWPVLLAGAPVILASLLFPQWLFQGLERMAFITVCSVSARLATIPLVFLLVDDLGDAWVAALITASGAVLAGLLAGAVTWRQRLVHWHRPTWAEVRGALRDSRPLFTSTAAISLYTTITPLLLALLTHTAAVGIFSAADRVRQACQSLLTPLSNAAFPRISGLMERSRDDGLALARRLLLIQAGLSCTAALLLWLLAPWIVQFVMGPGFEAAVGVLRLLAPVLLIVALNNVFGMQMMLPLGLKTSFTRIVVASGLVNMGLLAVLAPAYEAGGAALATLGTEVLVTLAMMAALHRAGIRITR